jgi:hypothetical protein
LPLGVAKETGVDARRAVLEGHDIRFGFVKRYSQAKYAAMDVAGKHPTTELLLRLGEHALPWDTQPHERPKNEDRANQQEF